MRKTLFAVLILGVILLCGCSQASQVENHAYVLVMGLDKTSDGQMKMTVQVPKISGSPSESTSTGGSGGNYMKFAVTARNFEAALEKLDWASPRDMNLSQIKLIVLSRELAEAEECRKLIENIAQTERLYTATKIAVCEGRAEDFVTAIQPKIGTRISTDIDAMYEHYTSRGYVPGSSLADLFYLTQSVYSDPMVSYALLDKQNDSELKETQQVSALSGDIKDVSASYDSEIPTRYLGAAVFVDGRMRGVLNGTQTVLTNLLRNEIEAMRYECDGQSLNIVPARPVYVYVDVNSQPVQIKIDAKLALAAQEELPEEEKLRRALNKDIREAIETARRFEAEPFGFAEKAARKFITLASWNDFDWKEQFLAAEIEIDLSFAHSDA